MMDRIHLRLQVPEDAEFLFALYAGTRAAEMEMVPWSGAEIETFLRQQFAAQTHHYTTYYPNASCRIIQQEEQPVGRLYINREPEHIHILDIALLPAACGQGIGTYLLGNLLAEADRERSRVTIFVELNNPAQRLYERLGFVRVKEEGMYYFMERLPCDNPGVS